MPPRYCPERSLPSYSYVPGLGPHPISDPRGHSFGVHEPPPAPLDAATFRENAAYLWAIDLFNHGYYWEAHEAWESLWHAAGRTGPTADFLKGLIKLAAAGVKLREGRPTGVKLHAIRGAELLTGAMALSVNEKQFGLNMAEIVAVAQEIATRAGDLVDSNQPDATRRLPLDLRLTDA